jgi:hypothetical protein
VSFHPLGGAAALFDPVSQRVFTLDEPEAVAWCLLAEVGGARDEAAADLARAAGLPPGEAAAWLDAAAAQWSAAGLLDGQAPMPRPLAGAAGPVWPPPGGGAARLDPGAVAARRRYRVLDSVVEVAFEDAGLAAAADAVLGGLGTDAPPTLACEVARLEDGSGWAVAIDGRVAERIARIRQSVPALKLTLTRLALGHARGFAAVHAAAVARAGDGGRTALLPAPAGSGKSTLAAGCVLAGWELVADDTVVLDDAADLLRPMPLALCLKEGSWPVLRRAGADIDALPVHERPDERSARYLAPRTAADGPRALAAIVAPRWEAGAAAELRPASPRDAFDLLLPQVFPLPGPPLSAEAVARVASLAERVPCFTLSYDALADGVRLVGEALEP